MHKTSSTSVQHNLEKIRDDPKWRLLNVGGRANMGPAVHAMFLKDRAKCVWLMKRGHTAESAAERGEVWKAELQKTISEFQGEICIISGESLTDNVFCEEAVASLRDFLKPHFDDIRVIGYVRPPAQYKNSRFQERIKHRANDFSPEKIHYRKKFEKFDNVFGRENVVVRKFNPSAFPNGCAVADFCQQVGITLPEDFRIKRLNESLSREACGILYAYRKFGSDIGTDYKTITEINQLVRALQAMGGSKLAFSAPIIESALKREKKDIRWMEQRLGGSLAERYEDTADKIRNEDDLLMISQASCMRFIKSFENVLNRGPLPALYPVNDPVPPKEVAALLQNCRQLVRQKIEKRKSRKTSKHGWLRRLKRIPRFIVRNFRLLTSARP